MGDPVLAKADWRSESSEGVWRVRQEALAVALPEAGGQEGQRPRKGKV